MRFFGDGRGGEATVISPVARYRDPEAVLRDPRLTRSRKRAILSMWASDACAVDSDPTLRRAPGGDRAVKVGDIFAALARLDHPTPPYGGGAAVRPPLADDVVPARNFARRPEPAALAGAC